MKRIEIIMYNGGKEMKIVKPEAHVISRSGVTPYQFIERIGRTCYKSLDKITEDSAVKFVCGLKNSKHYAMLEHYWVHIMVDCAPERCEV